MPKLTFYISADGSDAFGDGSEKYPWFSIQKARDAWMSQCAQNAVEYDADIIVTQGEYDYTEENMNRRVYLDKELARVAAVARCFPPGKSQRYLQDYLKNIAPVESLKPEFKILSGKILCKENRVTAPELINYGDNLWTLIRK